MKQLRVDQSRSFFGARLFNLHDFYISVTVKFNLHVSVSFGGFVFDRSSASPLDAPPLPLHPKRRQRGRGPPQGMLWCPSGMDRLTGGARQQPAFPGKFSLILRALRIVVGCIKRAGAGRAGQLARAHSIATLRESGTKAKILKVMSGTQKFQG